MDTICLLANAIRAPRSVIGLTALGLPILDYTTLCHRRSDLQLFLPRRLPKGAVHVVVDATGLKVFCEEECFLPCFDGLQL
jgi:hypothetical protein